MKHYFKQSDWDEDVVGKVEFNTNKANKKQKKANRKAKVDQSAEEVLSSNLQPESEEPKIKSKNKQLKHDKTKNNPIKKSKNVANPIKIELQETSATLSSNFSNKLRENLKSGRFRFINEQLYTIKGDEAKKLFENDLESFASYHEGYRNQVEKWPMNPLNRIINKIKKLPKNLIIADFGCGDAKLADSIKNQVFSIDLVSTKPNVIACDMAHTTLNSNDIDVAVYCLSLMGTNINEFLMEANRVLKIGGNLMIAEIASRFENIKIFINLVERFGFKMLRRDQDEKKFFLFFDFQKISNADKRHVNSIEIELKPCIYKKR